MKVSIMGSDIGIIRPILAALGQDFEVSYSIPRPNKYKPHQGNKEKLRRLKQLEKGNK